VLCVKRQQCDTRVVLDCKMEIKLKVYGHKWSITLPINFYVMFVILKNSQMMNFCKNFEEINKIQMSVYGLLNLPNYL
jgi:hypothetical protein